MRRSMPLALALLGAALAAGAPASAAAARRAWPLRARVTSTSGRSVAFRAVAHGGAQLMVGRPGVGLGRDGLGAGVVVAALAAGDTLVASAPAEYPVDLGAGEVVFAASGRDSLEVVVTRRLGSHRVAARGRRLVVRQTDGGVRIESR